MTPIDDLAPQAAPLEEEAYAHEPEAASQTDETPRELQALDARGAQEVLASAFDDGDDQTCEDKAQEVCANGDDGGAADDGLVQREGTSGEAIEANSAEVLDIQSQDAQSHDAQSHDAQAEDAQAEDSQAENVQSENAQEGETSEQMADEQELSDAVVDEEGADEELVGEEEAVASDEEGDGAQDAKPALEKPVWTAAQQAEQLRMVEALLFASADALDVKTIAGRLPAGAEVKVLLAALSDQYQNRGIHLQESGGKWRFITAPDVAHILEKEKVEQRKLSRAALETLAIIAYHQPCTRADIEDVRGVAVSKGSLDQLLEIGWVRLRGRRKDVPGRPVLYGTTQGFLEHFTLQSVEDLPGMSDLKAAGLLDARLPPGFAVPTPKSDDGEEDDAESVGEGQEAVFAEDYLEEGAQEQEE